MTNDQLRLIIQNARDYIEEGWTQRAMARIGNGFGIDPVDPRATCWCLVGALRRATHFSNTMSFTENAFARSRRAFSQAYNYLEPLIPYGEDMIGFNDAEETTQEDVLKVLDTALKRL